MKECTFLYYREHPSTSQPTATMSLCKRPLLIRQRAGDSDPTVNLTQQNLEPGHFTLIKGYALRLDFEPLGTLQGKTSNPDWAKIALVYTISLYKCKLTVCGKLYHIELFCESGDDDTDSSTTLIVEVQFVQSDAKVSKVYMTCKSSGNREHRLYDSFKLQLIKAMELADSVRTPVRHVEDNGNAYEEADVTKDGIVKTLVRYVREGGHIPLHAQPMVETVLSTIHAQRNHYEGLLALTPKQLPTWSLETSVRMLMPHYATHGELAYLQGHLQTGLRLLAGGC